jgi:hypothetical protein
VTRVLVDGLYHRDDRHHRGGARAAQRKAADTRHRKGIPGVAGHRASTFRPCHHAIMPGHQRVLLEEPRPNGANKDEVAGFITMDNHKVG